MSQHEIDSSKLRRDTRSFEEKVYEWLLDLNNVRLLLIGRVALQFLLVAIWPVSLFTSLIFWANYFIPDGTQRRGCKCRL